MSFALCLGANSAFGQVSALNRDTHLIKRAYFATFGLLYDGDYSRAMDSFRNVWRGGIKTVDARWIDSICYYTMIGEMHYRLGQHRQALENYDSALRLYIQYPDWMLRVDFPARIEADQNIFQPPPWGGSKRRFRLGRFPDVFSIARGGLRVVAGGGVQGVANKQELHPLDVDELMRCTTLAIQRRKELLGPVARHDRLTQEILNTLSLRQGPPNHWSQCWIDLALGAAFAANDKNEAAVKALQQSLLAAGEFDHPLTCVAMLELGKLALADANHKAAATWFEEALVSAYYFDRVEVIEEAFRLRQMVHLITGGKGIFQPLIAAANWANVKNLAEVQASLLILIAENYAISGDIKRAMSALSQATRAVNHEDLSKGWLAPRLNYVTALLHYFRGSEKPAEMALAAAMQYQQNGSIKLFQIAAADAAYVNGHVRERTALELYEVVLGDPSPDDWRRDPLESLTALMFPQPTALEHWFEAAMKRDDALQALEILDRIRRARFFEQLTMGGRLLALRWVLNAPLANLPKAAQLQRADIAARHPLLAKLQAEADTVRQEIVKRPLIPQTSGDVLEQGRLLSQLAAIGRKQEEELRKVAIAREPAELVFPPLQKSAAIQQVLRPDEAVLVLYAGKQNDHAFLLSQSKQAYWKIDSPARVRERLSELLRSMGHYDQGRELDGQFLSETDWKLKSLELATEIFGEHANLDGYRHLIIVPDGFYWYVPFEALYVATGRRAVPLLYKTRVRYAPTLGLAVGSLTARRQSGEFAVVQGRLFPREDPALATEAFNEIKKIVPRAHAVTQQLFGPANALSPLLEGLIVLDDIEPVDRSPLDMAPFQVNRGKPGASIREWIELPFGDPDIVLLPGFHTPAENSLKRVNTTVRPGDELFLTTMGLLAGGSRTILISRWRTAGQAGNDLMREFLQEYPNTTAADAWQRSVQLAFETPVDAELEPRVRSSDGVPNLTAAHPFFWSGFLLIDPGDDPAAVGADRNPLPTNPDKGNAG